MAYSETSGEEVDLDNPNLDAALHQAEQLLGIPPEQAKSVYVAYMPCRLRSLSIHLVSDL